jgi:F-type H+-transporting ATPase subunit b
MPQINQLPLIFGSQLFWLLLVFGIIFFGVARAMLPRIQSVVSAREQSIAKDQELAEAAHAAAEETEAAWRERMDAARNEARRIDQEAKQASARATEARVQSAVEDIDRRTDLAVQRIRDAVAAARDEMDLVAADAASEIVERLVGIKVDRKGAAAAVAAVPRRPVALLESVATKDASEIVRPPTRKRA